MTETDAEALKLITEQLSTGETRLYDHIATTFRWLMATLFTANGGAIVALIDRSPVPRNEDASAMAWFAGGLVLSILMGITSTLMSQRASARMTAIRAKAQTALLLGVVDDEIVPALLRQKPNWKTWTPSYVGGAAFLCLIIGILTIASHL